MLNRLIEQLSHELGWKEPVLKENDGSFVLQFEPHIRILLKEENPTILRFFSHLGSLPADREGDSMLKMMAANLLGKHTGRNILGLDKEGKEIVLLNFLLGSINYKQFRNSLEDFINYTEVLSDEIKG